MSYQNSLGLRLLVFQKDATDSLSFEHFLLQYRFPKGTDCGTATLVAGAIDWIHYSPARFNALNIHAGGDTLLIARLDAVINN
jgi:hypothetical protein